jgi:hypothetical protein
MSEEGNGRPQHSFNIIKSRGSPDQATTLTGHLVTKKEMVIIPSPFDGVSMISITCADYHDEHFVYIDPMFEKDLPENEERSYWFAMCTCGSPAAIIGGGDVARHEGTNERGAFDNMLVCQFYYQTLIVHGYGYHANQDQRMWR